MCQFLQFSCCCSHSLFINFSVVLAYFLVDLYPPLFSRYQIIKHINTRKNKIMDTGIPSSSNLSSLHCRTMLVISALLPLNFFILALFPPSVSSTLMIKTLLFSNYLVHEQVIACSEIENRES